MTTGGHLTWSLGSRRGPGATSPAPGSFGRRLMKEQHKGALLIFLAALGLGFVTLVLAVVLVAAAFVIFGVVVP